MLRQSMEPDLLIEVFVSLLFERRIILRSNSLGTLTDVCSALESLLFPFKVTLSIFFYIFSKKAHCCSGKVSTLFLFTLN